MADALNLQNALNVARNIPGLTGSVTVVDDAGKVMTTVRVSPPPNPFRPISATKPANQKPENKK